MPQEKNVVLKFAPEEKRPGKACCCPCGAVQCFLTEGGVEIKCRRCKRVVVVPLSKKK